MVLVFTLLFFTFAEFPFSNSLLWSGTKPEGKNEIFGQKAPVISPSIQEAKFEQPLDHFNKGNSKTWKQLYFVKEDYFALGGPVYLWIWDTGPADPEWMEEGYWHSHGKKNNALLFLLEHRFYGQSQPFEDTSTENLKYINASQALADTAAFVDAMTEIYDLPDETKWIVFGGSYGASLAAWMRLKYPNLVYGAVASSATLEARLDFPAYLNDVGDSLASYKKQCKDDIAGANKKLDELVKTTDGRKEIGNIFQICSPLTDKKLDISHFVASMADYISYDVQYDRWGRKVERLCNKMLEDSQKKEPIKRYSNLMNTYLEHYGAQCLSTEFNDYVGLLQKTDFMSAAETNRVWVYQICSQFAWFQTTGKKSDTFSKHINVDYFVNLCSKVFKPSFNRKFISQAARKTNKLFGGLKIDESRIVFVHGTADPMRSIGISSAKNKKHAEVVAVEGGSHCSDLGDVTKSDPDAKAEAQKKIMRILDSWLVEE